MIAVTTVLIVLVAWPRMAPGVCFGDGGDLQTACATLGIAHPPGYTAYALAGWLVSRVVFFVDPARVVTVLCMGAMVASLAMVLALLIRMGLHGFAAGGLTLVLVWHGSVWRSMLAPEVYAPSLLCLTGAMYALSRYGARGGRRYVVPGALLLGVLVVSRPPSVVFVAGFAVGVAAMDRRRGVGMGETLRTLGVACACGVVPVVVAGAVVVLRDAPTTAYNYLGERDAVDGDLAPQASSVGARWSRLTWLIGAREYRGMYGASWREIRGKMRWVRRQLGVYDTAPFVCAVGVLVLGAYVLIGRGVGLAAAVLVVLVGQLGYLLPYRVHGQAADVLPILLAAVMLGGAALSVVFPSRVGAGGAVGRAAPEVEASSGLERRRGVTPVVGGWRVWLRGGRRRTVVVALAYGVACVWTCYYAGVRRSPAASADATGYVRGVGLGSLPRDAVVVGDWHRSRPLWYARCVQTGRRDVTLLTAQVGQWPRLAAAVVDRPVFFVMEPRLSDAWVVTPWRGLWRAERRAGAR